MTNNVKMPPNPQNGRELSKLQLDALANILKTTPENTFLISQQFHFSQQIEKTLFSEQHLTLYLMKQKKTTLRIHKKARTKSEFTFDSR